MKVFGFLFAYLFAYLAGVVKSCPPPFNAFRFADNQTLLEETMDQYDTNPELGWTHVINTGFPGSSSPLQVWPAGPDGIVYIKYCWADQVTKDRLASVVSRAWNSWSNAIGEAGPCYRRHRLGGFSEPPDFCYTDAAHSNWNPAVPGDTVMVWATVGSIRSSASLGYRANSW